jgi:hypothetical protein
LRGGWVVWAILALACATAPIQAADTPTDGYLRWHPKERRVDADLRGWTLQRTLERIAAASGWEVLVEPGIEFRVAARFDGRPVREALAALFSDLNFAVLPARTASGPTRLLVFRSTTSEATQVVKPVAEEASAAEAKVLAKELVVRLKKGSKADIEALARKLGAKVVGSIPGQDAYRLVFEDEAAASAARSALDGNEDVASVESNYAMGAPGRMDRVPGMSVPPLGLRARPMQDGSSVVVALLDTGVPASTVTHADFLLPGVSVASSSQPGESGLSHGPAMFETILQGLALGQQGADGTPVRVLPVDLYGGREETSTFELAQGIVVALERGADILNLSLSGPSPSPLVQDVLKQASQAGVLAFAAPGNEPTTANTYPAAYPEVIAVTAANRQGQLADYANRGGFVDLMAPGTSVVPYAGDTWVVNGTSVATAYTSGLAAGLLADSGRTPTDITRQLQQKLGFQAATATPPATVPAPKP